MRRPYRLKKRAQAQEETRRRIVQATMELHALLGPAATTISAIAERAGVERLTVYRHFPDLRSLFQACGELTMATYPPPDLAAFLTQGEGLDALEAALAALYGYYEARRDPIARFLRDGERVPEFGEEIERTWHGPVRQARDAFAAAIVADPARELRALVGQALDFWAWRGLRDQGLTNEEIVHLQRRLVGAIAAQARPHKARAMPN